MANCPKCGHYKSPLEIMTKPMYCRGCQIKLGFDRKEYGRVTRPGIFIALSILFNWHYTVAPYLRLVLNVILLVLWFIFFKRYIYYLKNTVMEARDQ